MTTRHLFLWGGLLCLGACASQPRMVVVHEPDPEQPPTHIPLQSEANVQVPSTVKAYPVARYVDPSNPRILHERHVIYRREEDEHWRLAANARQQILVGNLLSDSRQERHAAPYAQELPNLLRQNQQEARDLNRVLQAQVQQSAATAAALQNLGTGVQALNNRVGAVEKKLNAGNPTALPSPSPTRSSPPPLNPGFPPNPVNPNGTLNNP